MSYSLFANCLVKHSNVEIDRKILGNLAVNEPYSFKAVIDEVKVQAGIAEVTRRKPLVAGITAVTFPEAVKRGLIIERQRPEELKAVIYDEQKANLYGLRFPEKHSKKPEDYMRLSFKEEDEAFLEEQRIKSLTVKEQKKLPREVLTDNWQEDMSLYKNKRKP